MIDVFKKLDQLESLSKSLNKASDEINPIIDKFEQRLNELSFGVPAEVSISQRETTVPQESGVTDSAIDETVLIYKKLDMIWGLWVQDRTSIKNDDSNVYDDWDLIHESPCELLRSASRETRIDAIAGFSSLVDTIERLVQEKLKIIEKAKAELKK